jgi:hypothetical protein
MEKILSDLISILNQKLDTDDKATKKKIKSIILEIDKMISNLTQDNIERTYALTDTSYKFERNIYFLKRDIEKYENVKSDLKKGINNLRKERRKLIKQNKGLAIGKGIWRAEYLDTIDSLGNIYDICNKSWSSDLDYIMRKIKTVCKEYVSICKKCKELKQNCTCTS